MLFPQISHLLSEGLVDEARQAISTAWRYIILLLVPMVVIIVGCSRAIVGLLFGASYQGAAAPLRVLMFGYAMLTIFVCWQMSKRCGPCTSIDHDLFGRSSKCMYLVRYFNTALWWSRCCIWHTYRCIDCRHERDICCQKALWFDLQVTRIARIIVAGMIVLAIANMTSVSSLLLPICVGYY